MSATHDGPALTPLALDQIVLLQRLRAQDFVSKTELATSLGRDQSNLTKTLKRLEDEGLVHALEAALNDRGVAALEEYDRMIGAAPAAGPFRTFRHDELEPDALNPRQIRTPERIAELKDGIVSVGRVLEQILVRQPATPGGKPRIKAGVTRWEAVGLAIRLGELPADFPIPADVRESSDAETRLEATAENDQRADLNHIERARAYEDLAEVDGLSNAQISRLVGRTPEYVQQHRRLLRLPQEDQAKVAAKEVSLHQALRDLATPREVKAWEPTAQHDLVLAEVAAACAASSRNDGGVQAGRSAQHDGLLNKLVSEGYAGWSGDPDGARVWLSETGKARAATLGEDLNRIQLHAGVTPRSGAYATDWLPAPVQIIPRPRKAEGLTIADVEARRAPGFVEGGPVHPDEAMAEDDDSLVAIDAPPSPPTKPQPEDTPRTSRAQLAIMVETHHAGLTTSPTVPPGFATVYAPAELARGAEWQNLVFQGLAMTMTAPDGVYVKLLPRGVAELDRLDLNPETNPQAVGEALAMSNVAHGLIAACQADGTYVTPWLNPSAAPTPGALAAEPDEGADSHAPAPSSFLADEAAEVDDAATDDRADTPSEPPASFFAREAVLSAVEQVADYMREVAEDGDFDCSKASCAELAGKIAFYFQGEAILGVIGAATALYARGGETFSERNLRDAWASIQRQAFANAAFVPELDAPVTFGFELSAIGHVISTDDRGLLATLEDGIGADDAAAFATAPELLRAVRGLLSVAPNFAPDDEDVEAMAAVRYAQDVARRVAELADV